MTSRRSENENLCYKRQVLQIYDNNVVEQCVDGATGERPPLSPFQPKPLFYRSRIVAPSYLTCNGTSRSKNVGAGYERLDTQAASLTSGFTPGILKRNWRQEHNLRERDRRREESIIYELIRTCISADDIRRHLPGVNKKPENLSYHQILSISSKIVEKERLEMISFDWHKILVRTLEEECLRRGIPLPENRPHIICPMEKHRRYAEIIKEALQTDSCRMYRNANGDGEGLPTSREVALEIDKRLRESDRSIIRGSKRRFRGYDYRPPKRPHAFLPYYRKVKNEEINSSFTNRQPPNGAKGTPGIRIHPQSVPVDTIPSSPKFQLHFPHPTSTRHLDNQSLECSENEGVVDVAASDDVFNLPLLSPSAGVSLGIETEPLFRLLSSSEVDTYHADI